MSAELEAKRDALEKALAQPGIDKDERHDLNQRIVAVSHEILMWGGQLPPAVAKWDRARIWDAVLSGFWNGGGASIAAVGGTFVASAIGMPWAQAKVAGFAVGTLKLFLGTDGYQQWPSGTWPKPK